MQSRVDSFMEAATNTLIGWGVAVAANYIVLPWYLQIEVNLSDSAWIGLIFTAISLFRSYLLRRLFNGRSVWQSVRGN